MKNGIRLVVLAAIVATLSACGASHMKIRSEGELSAGFFGGDSDSAIKKAAGEIGDYAETNFSRT